MYWHMYSTSRNVLDGGKCEEEGSKLQEEKNH